MKEKVMIYYMLQYKDGNDEKWEEIINWVEDQDEQINLDHLTESQIDEMSRNGIISKSTLFKNGMLSRYED